MILLPMQIKSKYNEEYITSPKFFDEVFSWEHLYNSALLCKNNVMWKASVQNYMRNLEYNVSETFYLLKVNDFKFNNSYEFYTYERGKLRYIKSIRIRERVVQKVLCLYCLNPLFQPKFIYDNSASTKNKGLTFTFNRVKRMLCRHYKKYKTDGYVLLFDFKNYFGSINHNYVMQMIAKEIKDERLLKIIQDAIKVYTTNQKYQDIGIGLGSELSQFVALLFANSIDHLIKDDMRIKNYIRYMDDGMVISNSKEELHKVLQLIISQSQKLGLNLNLNKTHIVPISKGFTFLKKKISLQSNGSVTMNITRSSVTRMRRKLKKLKQMLIDGRITIKEVEGAYVSWRGFAQHFDSYNTVQNMNKLYKELFGYVPMSKKLKKKKYKKKIEKHINDLCLKAENFPSQYEDESQRYIFD